MLIWGEVFSFPHLSCILLKLGHFCVRDHFDKNFLCFIFTVREPANYSSQYSVMTLRSQSSGLKSFVDFVLEVEIPNDQVFNGQFFSYFFLARNVYFSTFV